MKTSSQTTSPSPRRAIQHALWLGSLALLLGAGTAAAQYTYRGPTTSVEPYYRPSPMATAKGYQVSLYSLVTVADPVIPDISGYRMIGIPDGAGAYDNGDGTFTMLVNHEIFGGVLPGGEGVVVMNTNATTGVVTVTTNGVAAGVARAYGGKGATVSEWVFSKTNLAALSGKDLIRQVQLWDPATRTFRPFDPTNDLHFSRFCSADLPPVTAFYNAASGKGTESRIFMNGEEVGGGRAFAHIASGPEKGTSYELPYLGRFSWENAVPCPTAQDITIVAGLDDGGLEDSQVYFYIGTKWAFGSEIDRAGLHSGFTYGVRVEAAGVYVPLESNEFVFGQTNRITSARFRMYNHGNASQLTAAELNTISLSNATSFFRVEDGAWDPTNPRDFYFVTTGRAAGANVTHASRLYRLRFNSLADPLTGGTIDLMLDGPAGNGRANSGTQVVMMDNIGFTKDGKILIQEDPGGNDRLARVWLFDPQTRDLTDIAMADPKFTAAGGAAFLTNDEESSGIIDASEILGPGWYLWDIQMHLGIRGELVEHGQLMAMHIARAPLTTTSTSVEPYYKPSHVAAAAGGYHVTIKSLVTVADPVVPDIGGYRMVGLPDGLGAYDNGNGTFTLLVNHEIVGGNLPGGEGTSVFLTNRVPVLETNQTTGVVITNLTEVVTTNTFNARGIAREYGGKGAFISEWVIAESNLTALSGRDLIKKDGLFVWDRVAYRHRAFDPVADFHLSRFCSADLPPESAFLNRNTGRGIKERLYLNGEEDGGASRPGQGGRAFAHVVNGSMKGTSYELPYFGLYSWENVVASPFQQDKTVVIGLDDSELTNSQVYVHIGTKKTSGSVIERAGLHPALTYVVRLEDNGTLVPTETNDKIVGSQVQRTKVDFKLYSLGDVSRMSEAELDSVSLLNGTSFFRVEDGAWDPQRPTDFYFVTTGRASGANVTHASRLWRLCFHDIARPEAGGFIELVLNGPAGNGLASSAEQPVMMDNICFIADGRILIQEDPGNNDRLAKIWIFDPVNGALTELAAADPKFFATGGSGFLTRDEEASGIIDASEVLGPGWLLFDIQAHARLPGELVEHGQLNAMRIQDVSAFPSVRIQPRSQTISVGESLILSVVAQGTGPFTYQWFVNGQAIAGAAGAELALYGLQLNTNGAVYTVQITGPEGRVTSSAATIKVNPVLPTLTDFNVYPGFYIRGTVGGLYRVEYSDQMSGTTNWLTLTNMTLPSSPFFFCDLTGGNRPNRFYRLVVP